LDALVRSGLPHVPHHRVFKRGTPDEEWMQWVAPLFQGILGKDKAHRYTPREKRLIVELKLRVFQFSSGNLGGAKMGQLLKAALPQIERMMIRKLAPMVASITETGVHLRKLDIPESSRNE
jgi:PIN like domain